MLGRIQSLNVERIIALLLIVFGAAELCGALQLSVSEEFTLGPGALPVIYSVGLIIFAGILAVWPSEKSPGVIENPVVADGVAHDKDVVVPARDYRAGALTFALIFLLIGSIYVVGFFIGTVIFSFLFAKFITRWPLLKATVFAVLWGGAVYYSFDHLLEVQLEPGILFGS